MTVMPLRPLSIGEVLDVAFAVYRRHFRTLALVALVSQGVALVLAVFVEAAGGALEQPLLWLTSLVVSAICTAIGMGASTRVVADGYLGRATTPGEALAWVMPHVGRVFVLSALTTFVVGLGVVLLIVPGIILGSGLAVGSCALVLEGLSPLDAMNRSWQLTRGYRVKVFVTVLVVLALIYGVGMAAAMIGGILALATTSETVALVVIAALGGLLTLFIYPYVYAAVTVLYYDLRVRKEGFDLELLESQLGGAA